MTIAIKVVNSIKEDFSKKSCCSFGFCSNDLPPPPCFRIRGTEDNFIFYIEYRFFFVPVMKLRLEYNIFKQFQSISCPTV